MKIGIGTSGTLATLVLGFTPYWITTLAASPLAGFGFVMFHNTMQAHATQMAPLARGTAVSLFAQAMRWHAARVRQQ